MSAEQQERDMTVEEWEWQVIGPTAIELVGRNAEGERVARRTFKQTSTDVRVQVREDGAMDWVDADECDDGGWSPDQTFTPDDDELPVR